MSSSSLEIPYTLSTSPEIHRSDSLHSFHSLVGNIGESGGGAVVGETPDTCLRLLLPLAPWMLESTRTAIGFPSTVSTQCSAPWGEGKESLRTKFNSNKECTVRPLQ